VGFRREKGQVLTGVVTSVPHFGHLTNGESPSPVL
jgi:hypothetical protein